MVSGQARKQIFFEIFHRRGQKDGRARHTLWHIISSNCVLTVLNCVLTDYSRFSIRLKKSQSGSSIRLPIAQRSTPTSSTPRVPRSRQSTAHLTLPNASQNLTCPGS